MEGTTASISPPVGEVLYDEAYKNQAWTGSESFIFSDELPGGMIKWGQILLKIPVPLIGSLTIPPTTTLTSEQGRFQRLQSWGLVSL